jgi:hypothetical protein
MSWTCTDFWNWRGNSATGLSIFEQRLSGWPRKQASRKRYPRALHTAKGQMCELSVAFASAGHGLLHFWEEGTRAEAPR